MLLVSFTKLTSLPHEIGNLLNLTNLYGEITVELSSNTTVYESQLTFLPYEIGNLSNLKMLSAFQNKLTYLPCSFVHLRKLKQVACCLPKRSCVNNNSLR